MNTPAENLKCGNPALTDECTAYGLRRAAVIMAKHALKSGEGIAAFRKRHPVPLVLGEIQVAAICAEAYRAGTTATLTGRGAVMPFIDTVESTGGDDDPA